MWTPGEREYLRSELLEAARADPRIVAGALTGSKTLGLEDAWSDVDLAFGVREAADVAEALGEWTARMYEHHDAVHHVDMVAGPTTYRVFLLGSGLQVDLAFTPAAEFGPRGPAFKVLWGTAVDRAPGAVSAEYFVGMGWLYAIHARTSIVRGKLWAALHMVDTVRDHGLALAALRHGLPTAYGRGLHRLPADVTAPFEGALVARLDADELARALGVAVQCLEGETRLAAPELAERLRPVLGEIARSARSREGM